MKARPRTFARSLRRRLSNWAWCLGGGSALALVIGGIVRQTLPLRDLPTILAVATSAGIIGALALAAAGFGAALFGYRSVEVMATADERGVRVEGKRTKEYGDSELGGLLRHQDCVWLFRRNGYLLELKFEKPAEAESFEETVREGIGERRIELEPHPTAMTAPLTLMLTASSCTVPMVAAPKSPLQVRVAALAGLMDEDPGLAQELLEVSADPRLEKVAKAAQGSAEDWRRAVERLEREGELE